MRIITKYVVDVWRILKYDGISLLDKSHDPIPITTTKTISYGAVLAWAKRAALQRLSKDYSLVANLYGSSKWILVLYVRKLRTTFQ